MIQLQSRDYKILRLCYEQQFLTWEHVDSLFNVHKTIPYRRIGALKREGLVSIQYHPILGKSSLLRLTSLGNQIAEQGHSVTISQARQLNPNTLIHDALVTSVRLRLAEFWDAQFIPERAIKTGTFKEIPDGLFRFPSGKELALEVENSDKGRVRFLKLLDRWKGHPSIEIVLYVASTPDLFRVLQGYLEKSERIAKPLVTLILWEDLKNSIPFAFTQFGPAHLFSKKELFE